jgi:hypothetical protein
MAVLRFKTEFIEKADVPQGTIETNGDYTPGESPTWSEKEKCDAVLNNGPSEQIRIDDGTAIYFSYTIYLSPKCQSYAIGDKVRITFRDASTKEYIVKGVERRQLQCKLYV